MSDKPKIAFYWCASCGGCEEAVVDIGEEIFNVVEQVDIEFWPVAMDFKRKDIEALPDRYFYASLINGAIRTEEQKEMAGLLREKSEVVVAFGSCACFGGIPGLGNLYDREDILQFAYIDSPSTINEEKVIPQKVTKINGYELELPEFLPLALPLNAFIDVDYYIPGCAPPPELVKKGLLALLSQPLPEKGTIIAGDKSQCYTCPLNETKPEKLLIENIKRPHEIQIDPEKCYLAQGLICLGPVTRNGCEERCIKGGMPCRGCFGPAPGVLDQGMSALSALASILDIPPEEEGRLEDIINKSPDLTGYLYRFTYPVAVFQRVREDHHE